MERIKLGEIDSRYEVFAKRNGFDMTFEICNSEGISNIHDNLLDFADDILISSGNLGYFRMEAITKALLKGEEIELYEYEKELLL